MRQIIITLSIVLFALAGNAQIFQVGDSSITWKNPTWESQLDSVVFYFGTQIILKEKVHQRFYRNGGFYGYDEDVTLNENGTVRSLEFQYTESSFRYISVSNFGLTEEQAKRIQMIGQTPVKFIATLRNTTEFLVEE
ncbi:MAG: hypothetical protein JXR30_02050 [Alphaproteobacteria bacterium]|nr:hypothetical protein [Alphaproteobacteria bacterium]